MRASLGLELPFLGKGVNIFPILWFPTVVALHLNDALEFVTVTSVIKKVIWGIPMLWLMILAFTSIRKTKVQRMWKLKPKLLTKNYPK